MKDQNNIQPNFLLLLKVCFTFTRSASDWTGTASAETLMVETNCGDDNDALFFELWE